MIRVFSRLKGGIRSEFVDSGSLEAFDTRPMIWMDLLSPTPEEAAAVGRKLGFELPTRQETEEIEFSSRFWEDDHGIEINTYFFVRHENNAHNEAVSFTLRESYLVTIRYQELKIFDDFFRKLLLTPSSFIDGFHVLSGILAMRIDVDADVLEGLSKEIVGIGRLNLREFGDLGRFLEHITSYEHINITLRENLTDKQRVLSSLLKSARVPESLKKEFTMMIKDVNSLITSATFNFERLEYLQNLFLNFLSVEQNRVIKIFTVMSVIFLPPTLIASIYGMNFKAFPELSWPFGYPFALAMIIGSAVLPLYVFKKKGWL
ncbi:MAG: magnesium/cobalt transporter CorA [Geobacteraceae bacterium]|nr:magnesium/cobalt transporter CorA [Geobacteraceae bacterium]